jgi:ABC-type Fe3+ transport system permease subunit
MVALAGLRRILRITVGIGFAAALLALPTAALFDLGPDGEARFSFFPLVLTVFDPFIRTCVGQSLAVAITVAIGSRLLGVPLGRIVCRSRFVGGRLGRILVVTPIIFPPVFMALGLEGLPELGAGAERGFRYLGRLSIHSRIFDWTWIEARGWFGWVWIGLIQGVALVVFVLRDGVDRYDRSRHDAARAAELPDGLIWRRLVWPCIRPRIARTVKLIFALSLVECGIPLVFDLRRSIGYQIVESARGPDPFPRLAAISLVALGCLAAGSLFVRLWIGPSRVAIRPSGGSEPSPRCGISTMPWPLEIPAMLVLATWVVAAWLPLAGLARLTIGRNLPIGRILTDLTDPRTVQLLLNTLIVAAAAAATALLLGGLKSAGAGRTPWRGSFLMGRISILPPVILGVAVLALPRLMDLVSRTGQPGRSVAKGAAALDPTGFPLRLLLVAVCLDVARRTRPRGGASTREQAAARDRLDVARTLGVNPPWAWRPFRGGDGWTGLAQLGFVAVAAGLSVAPAIVLGPTAEGRTISPGIIELAGESAESHARAGSVAFCLCVLLLVGWIAAALPAERRQTGFLRMLFRWCDLDERRQ